MNKPPKELLNDLLPGERCYPIYWVELKWSYDIPDDRPADRHTPTDGLPEGRMWNGTGWHTMPAEEGVSENELCGDAHDQMTNAFGGDKYKGTNPADLKVSIKFNQWETWCSGWFSHWTWDKHIFTDEQVLRSFERYVTRIEEHNRQEGKMVDGYWQEPYCLMGAEDRYRWYGTATGDPNERTDAPCRCPHCAKRGILTIGH